MCGLTEMESYYLLNDVDLVHGMIENEFYEKLNEYLNAKFEVLHNISSLLGYSIFITRFQTCFSILRPTSICRCSDY